MSDLSNKLAVDIFDALYDDEDLNELEQKMVIRQALGFKLSTIAIIECEIEEQLQQLQQDKAELVDSLEVMSSFYGGWLKDNGIKPETCQNYAEARALLEKYKC